MSTAFRPNGQSVLGRIALLASMVLSGTGAIAATNPNATMTINSDPSPDTNPAQWATVSRDAVGTVGAADYYISYTVSITNPTNSSKNFRFVANIAVDGAVVAPPTQLVSSRPDCRLTVSTNPVQVTCPNLEVAKEKTVTFSLRFRTPTAGTSMEMGANLYFPRTSTTVAAFRSTRIELREQEAADYRQGFYTFVPTTGGTFCTGDRVDGGVNNPGCVAKSVDPITTTIVIANQSISTPTTARVQEGLGVTCPSGSTFTVCYDTTLTIPNATFNPPLDIYIRVDKSKIRFPVNLSAIVVEYDGAEVKDCATNPTLPETGKPCWVDRGIYPGDFVPADFRFDFYMYIRARNNGTYRLR